MKPYLKFGLISAASGIVWTLIMYLTELDKSDYAKPLGWIMILFYLAFVVLAVKDVRDTNNGYISFGEAFKTGFLTMMIGAVIGTIYFYIHVSFVDTNFIDHIFEQSRAEMMKQPNMTEEQIEQALKFTAMFMTPGVMAFFGLLMNLIGGLIGSLIVAAIMKKDPPPGEFVIE